MLNLELPIDYEYVKTFFAIAESPNECLENFDIRLSSSYRMAIDSEKLLLRDQWLILR